MAEETEVQETQVQEVPGAPQQPAEESAAETQELTPEKKSQIERIEEEEHFVHKKIKSVSFSVLSPQMVKKMSSAKIVTPELYDKEGYPVDGGLMDIRLGVIDPGLRCKTCGGRLKECIGHFGYIELARPVMHIKFTPIVLTILKSGCRDCGRILIPDNKISKIQEQLDAIEKEMGIEERRKKIKEIVSAMKTTAKCPHCKAKQRKIMLQKPTTVLEDDKRISPIEIRARLEKLTDADAKLFGINAPAEIGR